MILDDLLKRLRPRFVLPDRGTRDGIAHDEQHLRRELEAALRYFRALQRERLRWLGPLARRSRAVCWAAHPHRLGRWTGLALAGK